MTSIEAAADGAEAWFTLDRDDGRLAVGGDWTIGESARLDRELNALDLHGQRGAQGTIAIDASKLSRLDSAGAWLLLRTAAALEAASYRPASINDLIPNQLTFRCVKDTSVKLIKLDALNPHGVANSKSHHPKG